MRYVKHAKYCIGEICKAKRQLVLNTQVYCTTCSTLLNYQALTVSKLRDRSESICLLGGGGGGGGWWKNAGVIFS